MKNKKAITNVTIIIILVIIVLFLGMYFAFSSLQSFRQVLGLS